MSETEQLIQLIQTKQKLVALLAPSFPIMYAYPQIVGKLKRLGFEFVLEVSMGAHITNEQVLAVVRAANPEARFITNPCPTITRLIRNKYPQLLKYLMKVDSPMVCTAKISLERYPGYRPVFIGPCIAKKLEAREDYPNLNILVLTYKEINSVFQTLGIQDDPTDSQAKFDLDWVPERIYPLSGGLEKSCGVSHTMSKDQIAEVSGCVECGQILENFEKDPSIKLLDILSCMGGCIGGPGIDSTLTLDQRRHRVLDFWRSAT